MRALHCALSILALLTACAPPPPPPREPPKPAAPDGAAASAAPSGTALGALLNPVEEPPKKDTPPEPEEEGDTAEGSPWKSAAVGRPQAPAALSAADRLAIARAICESDAVAGGAPVIRCACPKYTDLPGDDKMRIEVYHRGQFSGPGRDEVVVATRYCETGASSGQTYGGRALVRRTPDGWRRVFYNPGALGVCTVIHSGTGRSRLVCSRAGGHMGIFFEELVLIAFDEKNGKVREARSSILDLETQVPPIEGYAYRFDIGRHPLSGQAAYQAGDDRALALDATVVSRIYCVGAASVCPGLVPSRATFALHYTFDGSKFHLAPASEAAFRKMKARGADGGSP